ncbi:hypothetical protein ACM66B_005402 [Microbotryomycetes sp. NB124-2]
MERVRPSLRELQQRRELDDEREQASRDESDTPAVTVVRSKPPRVASTVMPEPVPTISNFSEATTNAQTSPDGPQSKQKSRFALQREQEQEQLERTRRFNISPEQLDEALRSSPASSAPRMIGQVLERDVVNKPVLAPTAPGPLAPSPLGQKRKGFPTSSKGVFSKPESRPREQVQPSSQLPERSPQHEDAGNDLSTMMRSISSENDRTIAHMSPAEIEEQQRQIRQEMGLSDSIIKMLEARGRKKAHTPAAAPSTTTETTWNTRPSQLPKPRPPPPAVKPSLDEEDEGSPEYIRRHFFPNEQPNPALDWMNPHTKASAAVTSADGKPTLVFGLDGRVLTRSTADAPPTATELHVSSASEFTIPTLLNLTSSAVASQRSTALTVLDRLLSRAENADKLGEEAWRSLRIEAVTRAGQGIHDKHAGVVGAALALGRSILGSEEWTPLPIADQERAQSSKPQTALIAFLGTGALAGLAENLSHPRLDPNVLAESIDVLLAIVKLGNPCSPLKSEPMDQLVKTPRLAESVCAQFIAVPWPCSLDSPAASLPRAEAINLLDLLARSSRTTAKTLSDKGCIEATLRFLAVPPWELSHERTRALSYELVISTLTLWTTLARYGLEVGLRTRGAAPIESLLEHVSFLLGRDAVLSRQDLLVVLKNLELLTVWTATAIDPHITNHDITWSQVESWNELALESVIKSVALDEVNPALLSKGLDLLTAWLEGCKVNKERQGVLQREWAQTQLAEVCLSSTSKGALAIKQALKRLARNERENSEVGDDASLLLSAIRLCRIIEDSDDTQSWRNRFDVGDDDVDALFNSSLGGCTSRHYTALLLALSKESRHDLQAVLLATLCAKPGDEVALRDELLHTISNVSAQGVPATALEKCSVLGPFVQHAVVTASGGRVVAPLYPTPKDIKLTSLQYPFVSEAALLEPTWAMTAVDELLKSGTSPVFHHLPRGWTASELDVVQGALAMTAVYASLPGVSLKPPQLLFDLIKVFMLEKEAKSDAVLEKIGEERELFRNEVVHEVISTLISPLRISQQPTQLFGADSRPPSETIEGPSSKVSSAPFYQLYTDLIGLYDSISLGHDLFGLVLLPPLAMSYPSDFRHLFWFDYAQNLSRMTFRIRDVVSDRPGPVALSSFLEPVETSEIVLEAYVQALLSGRVTRETNEFLFFVAAHHVHRALFNEKEVVKVEVKRRWSRAMVSFDGLQDVVKTVVRYTQAEEEGERLVLPPECYAEQGETFARNKSKLLELVGSELHEKVEKALA